MKPATTQHLYTFTEYLTYCKSTDESYELVDGKLLLLNPPTVSHFLITDLIEQALTAEIQRLNLPWVPLKRAGVRTGKNKARLTDICLVTLEQASELPKESAVFQSPPLLVVQIVTPESVKRDYRYKRSEYAALGVPEYWIVDPIQRQVSVLVLQEGIYEEVVFTENQQILSQTFPKLSLTLVS